MKNIKKYLYNGSFEGMKGIILESRSGAKNSKNVRNPNYKDLLNLVLEYLRDTRQENIQIFIASKKHKDEKYKTLGDRILVIDNEISFDFSKINLKDFIPKLNNAIRKSGQKEGTIGGNSTKRLFFLTNEKLPFDLIEKEEESENFSSNLSLKNEIETLLENFKFPFKKGMVKELQESLKDHFETTFKDYQWKLEYKPSDKRRDCFDIYGVNKNNNHHIVIELDTHRADQIAKKFVSRMAIMLKKNVTYIAFLYPGTNKMSKKEANKYFSDCQNLTACINKDKYFKEFIGHYLL
jgi:hypothetical protein